MTQIASEHPQIPPWHDDTTITNEAGASQGGRPHAAMHITPKAHSRISAQTQNARARRDWEDRPPTQRPSRDCYPSPPLSQYGCAQGSPRRKGKALANARVAEEHAAATLPAARRRHWGGSRVQTPPPSCDEHTHNTTHTRARLAGGPPAAALGGMRRLRVWALQQRDGGEEEKEAAADAEHHPLRDPRCEHLPA